MKLAVFDFDSTLMDGETIDFLAEELGIGEQVAKITEEVTNHFDPSTSNTKPPMINKICTSLLLSHEE